MKKMLQICWYFIKKRISLILSVLVLLVGSFIGYGVFHENFIERKNKECYESVQKIKPNILKDHWQINEQKYSELKGTCVYFGTYVSIIDHKIVEVNDNIMELYTDKILISNERCNNKNACDTSNSRSLEKMKKNKNEFEKTWDSYR